MHLSPLFNIWFHQVLNYPRVVGHGLQKDHSSCRCARTEKDDGRLVPWPWWLQVNSCHWWLVLSCPWRLMLYFKTFSPATVLKLFLEHLKMKLLGRFLMSREFPKLTGKDNGFFTIFSPFSHSDFFRKCFWKEPIGRVYPSETFNWTDTSGYASENLDKHLIFIKPIKLSSEKPCISLLCLVDLMASCHWLLFDGISSSSPKRWLKITYAEALLSNAE